MARPKTYVTGKTMDLLRKRGEFPEKVEYYVDRPISIDGKKIPGFRKDLFGFCDVISIKIGSIGSNYYQITTASNSAARMKKALAIKVPMIDGGEIEIVRALLLTKNRVFIVGWRKIKNRWRVRETEVVLEDRSPVKIRLGGDVYSIAERIGIDTLLKGKIKSE